MDGHDREVGAQALGHACGQGLGLIAVEAAGHADQVNVLGSQGLAVDAGGQGGIYAAGNTDDGLIAADGGHELTHAADQHFAQELIAGEGGGYIAAFAAPDIQALFQIVAPGAQDILSVPEKAAAAEQIVGLAAVLQTEAVHGDEGPGQTGGQDGLVRTVRPVGYIDDQIDFVAFIGEFPVTPVAQQETDAAGPALDSHFKYVRAAAGREHIVGAGDVAVSHGGAQLLQLAVSGHKDRIIELVFPLVKIAEDDGDITALSGDAVAAFPAFPEEGPVFHFVIQKASADGQLRENNHLRPGRLGLGDQGQHLFRIFGRRAGLDRQLGDSYRHKNTSL